MESYLRTEVGSCVEQGVRVEVLGRRDRLPHRLREAITAAEGTTAGGSVLRLRLAVDYSSRDAIVAAAAHAPQSPEEFAQRLDPGSGHPAPDVDLVIRTGGEQRLSDFLLWESAYAELYFTDLAWPDFDAAALDLAMAEFSRRQRRFGGLESVTRTAAAAS
jgi:undecaprenyl diphosphate synthase